MTFKLKKLNLKKRLSHVIESNRKLFRVIKRYQKLLESRKIFGDIEIYQKILKNIERFAIF